MESLLQIHLPSFHSTVLQPQLGQSTPSYFIIMLSSHAVLVSTLSSKDQAVPAPVATGHGETSVQFTHVYFHYRRALLETIMREFLMKMRIVLEALEENEQVNSHSKVDCDENA